MTREERLIDIKGRVRMIGLSKLPTYRELGEEYGVKKSQIHKDIHELITQLDPHELDAVFTDFYQSDLRSLEILKEIIESGGNEDKMKAINSLVKLQEGCSKLLESFAKKKKVADLHEVKQVSYNFTMNKPEEKEIVYDIVTEGKDEKQE